MYSYVVIGMIAVGGNLFGNYFMGYDDNFECAVDEFVADDYKDFYDLAKTMKDRASCAKVIQQIFDIEDINNDNYVERCEDAKFQHAMGSIPYYAKKFSSAYTRDSFNQICNENFEI